MVIDVELLVTDMCPHLDAAIDVIAAAAAREDLLARVTVIEVGTDAEAARLGFSGSPTIRVAGVDVSPDPEAVGGVLACRVYRTGHRVSGTPDVDLVRAALRAAIRP